jgi:DNA helicase-2/ATP-dependent DNA helicase PcrA
VNKNLDSISTFEGLDAAQVKAVESVEGPVRITAVAGAGKTRTITRRIAYACQSGLWEPSKALAVAFSVKAANEMRLRLAHLGVSQVTTATFHAAALSQLRYVWPMVSDASFPDLVTDTRQIVQSAAADVDGVEVLTPLEVRLLTDEISWAKVGLIAPGDYPRVCAALGRVPPAGLDAEKMAQVLEMYEKEKAARNSIDFNDILMLLCHVIDENADVANKVRERIGWLTVDEYQDVSPLQHHLMRSWLGSNRNVCVVGDPAQTIYSFAGATSYYLLNFAEEFEPLAADVDLQKDYRSADGIIDYANEVLRASEYDDEYLELVPADSVPSNGRRSTSHSTSKARGESAVRVARFKTDADEAHQIAEQVQSLLDLGANASEIAVLGRTNAQLELICTELNSRSIPYALRRVDASGSQMSPISIVHRNGAKNSKVLSPPITVSTIHAAKGLEWDDVFICGLSEGLLPYSSPDGGEELEEERRLMYVGVTRARKELYLSYALAKDEASSVRRVKSRFLVR